MRRTSIVSIVLPSFLVAASIASESDAQTKLSSPSSITYEAGSAADHAFYVDGSKVVDISSAGLALPEFTATGVVTNSGSGLLVSSTTLPSGLTLPSPIFAASQTIIGNYVQSVFHDTHTGSCTDGSLARITNDGAGNFLWQTNIAAGCDFSVGRVAYAIDGATGIMTAPNLIVNGSSRWPMDGPPISVDFAAPCPGPFGAAFAQLQICYSHAGSTSNGINSGLALTGNVDGSGTFGPASSNLQLFVSLTKNNFLTSDQDGELDAIDSYVTQGNKGDADSYLGGAQKVRNGNTDGSNSDNGGVGLLEGGAQILAPVASFTGSIAGTTLTVSAISIGSIAINDRISGNGISNLAIVISQMTGTPGGSGTYRVSLSTAISSEPMRSYRITQDIHPVVAFQEAVEGLSGGHGYGFYVDDFLYPGYAAFQATTYNLYGGAAGSYGWIYLLNAVTDRNAANQYFAVAGDRAPTGYVPGDIIQGVGPNSKILRTTSDGAWHIVNAAKTAWVFTVTDAGTVTLPSYAGSGSRPVCLTPGGQLEAGTLLGGTVTCP